MMNRVGQKLRYTKALIKELGYIKNNFIIFQTIKDAIDDLKGCYPQHIFQKLPFSDVIFQIEGFYEKGLVAYIYYKGKHLGYTRWGTLDIFEQDLNNKRIEFIEEDEDDHAGQI